MKMKFSADKINYNFSQNPKSTNIQEPHRPYRRFKEALLVEALLVLLYYNFNGLMSVLSYFLGVLEYTSPEGKMFCFVSTMARPSEFGILLHVAS